MSIRILRCCKVPCISLSVFFKRSDSDKNLAGSRFARNYSPCRWKIFQRVKRTVIEWILLSAVWLCILSGDQPLLFISSRIISIFSFAFNRQSIRQSLTEISNWRHIDMIFSTICQCIYRVMVGCHLFWS